MKNKLKEKKLSIKHKLVLGSMSFSQIIIMIVSIFAFSFIIGGMLTLSTPTVKADTITSTTPPASTIPTGCCREGIDGSICQNMGLADAGLCKTALLPTACNSVTDCQSGCCYDLQQGTCSLNSPKSLCTSLNGTWDSNAQCNIQQCQLGCCVLGQEASLLTSRECTLKSLELGLEKNFQAKDADGTCASKTHLDAEGACVIPSADYTGLNDCKFTTKKTCNGDFYENILCTAKNLTTACAPSKQTTCLEADDKIYYLDSCGNKANVYDSSKYNEQAYWEKVLPSSAICSTASASCGNCDYTTGTRCSAYNPARDSTKPVLGTNVCKNLNCANNRKHGESWCINDYNNTNIAGAAPIGSRSFLGSCVEGEISITPCADFNQEVCVQGSLNVNNKTVTEAQCRTNDWRSCLAANAKTTYAEIQTECNKYSQCVMFLDLPAATTADGKSYIGLAGFKPGVENSKQGSAGGIGKELNKVMAQCVPRNTPGMMFWQEIASAGDIRNPQATIQRGLDSGGSYDETKAICSQASFSCVSEETTTMSGTSWVNKECYDGKSPWVDGLNERCKMVGPCAMNVNVAGELGQPIKNMTRMVLGSKTPKPFPLLPSQQYLDSLKTKPGIIKAGSLNVITAAVISIITGKATSYTTNADIPAGGNSQDQINQAASGAQDSGGMDLMSSLGLGAMAGYGMYSLSGAAWASSSSLGVIGASIAWVALAAVAGYVVGQLVGKLLGLSSGETQALSYAFAAGAALGMAMAVYTTTTAAGFAVGGTAIFGSWAVGTIGAFSWCWVCLVIIVIIMILTYIFTYSDVTYYITNYECVPWTPPVTGDCQLCNNDVRTCSDYRCRSLGQNCKYFTDNGEPGFCSDSQDIWSAKIKPWPEALTGENVYSQISDTGFAVESKDLLNKKVEAWQTLQFGILTDKPAICKVDNKHTASYDEMSTTMASQDSLGCLSGMCGSQGTNHKVALSPRINSLQTLFDTATLPLVSGDNTFYIRCRNFAGQTNEAEFAVKINVDTGPDLTAPKINGFNPASGSYIQKGVNVTPVVVYVDEPSTCKYSSEDKTYETMENNISCLNDESQVYLGNWPCYAVLNNIDQTKTNKFYFRCKDQPDLVTTLGDIKQQNTARVSKEYDLNVCQTGLNITRVLPDNTIISGRAPISTTLQVNTAGCISGGKSVCSYRFLNSDNSSEFINFFNTNANVHTQPFTNMPEGNSNIEIKCQDDAGNIATAETSINVVVDNQEPQVIKVYNKDSSLFLVTNEEAQCKYTLNSSLGCGFDFSSIDPEVEFMSGIGNAHTTTFKANQKYFVKCQDSYGNTNGLCAMVVKTYSD